MMKLYARDYNYLQPDEVRKFEEVKKQEQIDGSIFKRNMFMKYPKAVRHNLQLFPNNYLDAIELKEVDRLNHAIEEFRVLLTEKICTERDVIEFIKKNEAFFIVGSILWNYQFGHHEAYLFPEFPLGNSHVADYLLVGRSSGGYEFVFVEFEDPFNKSVIAKGDLGTSYRKGISQIDDWKCWLDSHFSSLREVFNKARKPGATLPNEFIDCDTSRIHFAVVSGSRKDYSDKTYRLRRAKHKNEDVLILHYDNLADFAEGVVGKNTY